MEEMLNDGLDSALDNEDMEDEIEEEVDKVLSELAVETAVQLPAAGTSREKPVKLPVKPTSHSTRKVTPFSSLLLLLRNYFWILLVGLGLRL